MERKVAEEKKARSTLEQQLAAERKAKKNEDAAAARAVALVTARFVSMCENNGCQWFYFCPHCRNCGLHLFRALYER